MRLGRAIDRADCAQTVLEATRLGTSNDEWALTTREAVNLLARGWPEDYPAGAVGGF
jgi:hypothetical protein